MYMNDARGWLVRSLLQGLALAGTSILALGLNIVEMMVIESTSALCMNIGASVLFSPFSPCSPCPLQAPGIAGGIIHCSWRGDEGVCSVCSIDGQGGGSDSLICGAL